MQAITNMNVGQQIARVILILHNSLIIKESIIVIFLVDPIVQDTACLFESRYPFLWKLGVSTGHYGCPENFCTMPMCYRCNRPVSLDDFLR